MKINVGADRFTKKGNFFLWEVAQIITLSAFEQLKIIYKFELIRKIAVIKLNRIEQN